VRSTWISLPDTSALAAMYDPLFLAAEMLATGSGAITDPVHGGDDTVRHPRRGDLDRTLVTVHCDVDRSRPDLSPGAPYN
jgi:hypothetical protein